MTFLYRLKSVFTQAFYFESPVITCLEPLDFVIEDKMLFMLSWEFAGKYKLSIPMLKKSYRSRVGSVILKLPPDTSSIHLKVKTWWRTSHYTLFLTRLKLDASTANQIIQELKPISELNLKFNLVKHTIYPCAVALPKPAYKGPDPAFNWNVEIHNNKLIYPDN